MVFCNGVSSPLIVKSVAVTILILIDGFLQSDITFNISYKTDKVTILILIDGFLQYELQTSIFDMEVKSQSLF